MPLKELDANPELRDDPAIKDFNDLPSFVKSYKETKAFVGSSLRPPGPDASPEARKEFYEKLVKHAPDLVPIRDNDPEAEKLVWSRLGRPAKREEYVANVPQGVEVDLDALRDAAEAGGLTKGQFNKLVERTVAGAQQRALAFSKDSDALKAEWGQAYADKLKNAAAVAQKLGQPEHVTGAILAGKLPSASLRTWDLIATSVGKEGAGTIGVQGGSRTTLTPDEAKARFKGNPGPPGVLRPEPPGARGLRQEGRRHHARLAPGLDFGYKEVLLGRRAGARRAAEGRRAGSGRRPSLLSPA
jgi:hypothetical protein